MTVGNTYKYIYKKNCENPTGHPYGGAEYRWGIVAVRSYKGGESVFCH